MLKARIGLVVEKRNGGTRNMTKKPITKLKSKRAIFNRVKNPKYWKRPTKRVVVRKRSNAEKIGRAISHYVGGYEIHKTKKGYRVGSKGYYYYIGA